MSVIGIKECFLGLFDVPVCITPLGRLRIPDDGRNCGAGHSLGCLRSYVYNLWSGELRQTPKLVDSVTGDNYKYPRREVRGLEGE